MSEVKESDVNCGSLVKLNVPAIAKDEIFTDESAVLPLMVIASAVVNCDKLMEARAKLRAHLKKMLIKKKKF